jgi:hypothetical protein
MAKQKAATKKAAKGAPALKAILTQARAATAAKRAAVPVPAAKAAKAPAPILVPAGVKKNGEAKLPAKRSEHVEGCPCTWCRLKRGEGHRPDCLCKSCKAAREEKAAAVPKAAKVTKPGKAPAPAKGAAL